MNGAQASIAHIRFEYLLPVLAVPALYFAGRVSGTLHRKDRFPARLFAEHRDIWDVLGGPRGWQWSPPGDARAPVNSLSIYFDWFFGNEPSWLLRAPELRPDYHSVRAGIRRWNFVEVPILIGMGLLFAFLVRIAQ